MERLTFESNLLLPEGERYELYFRANDKKDDFQNAIDKLGKLEDIETDMGISFNILFKAIISGFYYVDRSCFMGERIEFARPSCGCGIEKNDIFWYLTYNGKRVTRIEDYGKSWALTREELKLQKSYISIEGVALDDFFQIYEKGIWVCNKSTNNELEHWGNEKIQVIHDKIYRIINVISEKIVNVCEFGYTWWIEKPKGE